MRKSVQFFAIVPFLLTSAGLSAEVVVREEPLTWEKSGQLSGEAMYRNLCEACHGQNARGNGKAAVALDIHAPDLTVIAAANGGVFPHKRIERAIADNSRHNFRSESVMPAWEEQFMWVRSGLNSYQREAYARNRIHVLATYIESVQGLQ